MPARLLSLASCGSQNIVQLIKVACRPPLCIVTELLVCSLHQLLHHNAGGQALRETMLAPGAQQLRICVHIARGMNYLHTLDPPVLHRNLKSQNLLVDEAGKVKIGDFGWSRLKTFDAGKTFFHGWQWVAPEILWGGQFTEMADVYSYSMVAWEVRAPLATHVLSPPPLAAAPSRCRSDEPLPLMPLAMAGAHSIGTLPRPQPGADWRRRTRAEVAAAAAGRLPSRIWRVARRLLG